MIVNDSSHCVTSSKYVIYILHVDVVACFLSIIKPEIEGGGGNGSDVLMCHEHKNHAAAIYICKIFLKSYGTGLLLKHIIHVLQRSAICLSVYSSPRRRRSPISPVDMSPQKPNKNVTITSFYNHCRVYFILAVSPRHACG